jgi:hypothetical protein
MRRVFRLVTVMLFFCCSASYAKNLPEFHTRMCTYRAKQVVVVKTVSAAEGKFRVEESWKGDLKQGGELVVPGLVKEAKGHMILFLKYDANWESAVHWHPAGFDWHTTVVWLDEDDVAYAVEQQNNPGPAEIVRIGTRSRLKENVRYFLKTEADLAAAKGTKDVDRRVGLLAAIVNGDYDRKDEAFVELGRCGPKALPILRKFLSGPANYSQYHAVMAFAESGGKDVGAELASMLEEELAYWKKVAPTLKLGWYTGSDHEPSQRFTKLNAFIYLYETQRIPELRKTLSVTRDLLRTFPTSRSNQLDQMGDATAKVLDRLLYADEQMATLFDGRTLDGWEYDPKVWTVKDGVLHAAGQKGLAYTKADYGNFRLFIFSRTTEPWDNPEEAPFDVLFWGDQPVKGKLGPTGALRVVPALGTLWDDRAGKRVPPNPERFVPWHGIRYQYWCTYELLVSLKTGEVRMAAEGREIARYLHPTPDALRKGPIGIQLREGTTGMEFKSVAIEIDPKRDKLVTTKW